METIESVSARVDVLEAKLPTLATKEDLANLKADIRKDIAEQTRWLATFVVTITIAYGTALTGAVYYIASHVHP